MALDKALTVDITNNSLLVSSDVEKDSIKCFADEILHSILEDMGQDVFCLLVEESRDVSYKEQMAVVLRYVDKCGIVKENLVGIVRVKDTTAANLESCIDPLFARLNKVEIETSKRSDIYDGASNMLMA